MTQFSTWYRIQEETNIDNEVILSTISCPVMSFTPKGAWILDARGKRRFVLFSARKKYALRTVEEAMISFLARKERQHRIYTARLRITENAIALVKQQMEGYTP